MFLLTAASTLLGLFIGSFLNVCIDRLPQDQSIITPPSHCPNCKRKLGVLDLIPLLSYIWLRGRCRYCKERIPLRLPIVEAVTGFLFGFLAWRLGFGLQLATFLIYASVLIVIFVIDLENQLVLDKVSYPAMLAAFIFSFFLPEPGVRSALIGVAVGGGIYLLLFYTTLLILRQEGVGFGDVKMAALMGLMLGFPLIIEALLLSWIGGGFVAIFLLLSRQKRRRDAIPTATFMAVAAMVALLWGQSIYNWYLP